MLLSKRRFTQATSYSLRTRLLTVILSASALLWMSSLVIMVGVAWHQSRETFDHTLREAGYLIIAATTDLHRRGVIPPVSRQSIEDDLGTPFREEKKEKKEKNHDDKHRVHYQIVINNAVQLRTDGTPETPFVPQAYKGFANVKIKGEYWRVFAAHNHDGTFSVQVGQTQSSRQIILYSLAKNLILPALALLTLLGIICWLSIRKLLRPIEKTAQIIAQKSPADLSPLSFTRQARELEPITTALNRVLQRLDHALQAERHFTADAAHELRTPLAALRTQAQLLQRQHPILRDALQKLIADIDRSTSLVEHLLTLARLDVLNPADQDALQKTTFDLSALLQGLLKDYEHESHRSNISISLTSPPVQLHASPQFIQIAIRNLLNNAFRYCPSGSHIQLDATQIGHTIRITVTDNGPGVPEELIQRLTQRFFRILGSGKTGSGLGLSIVARIAELHQATLTIGLGQNGKGLNVTLDFPQSSENIIANPPKRV